MQILQNCVFVFPYTHKENRGVFCSKKCYSLFMVGKNKGKQNPFYKGGKIEQDCMICKTPFLIYPHLKFNASKGKYCSKKCADIARKEMFRGSKSCQWKGGIYPLNSHIRNSNAGVLWKKHALQRDNYTCKKCGQPSGRLHVHHKKEFSKLLQDFLLNNILFAPAKYKVFLIEMANKYKPFWDLKNGITLCEKCHLVETHKIKGN